MTVPENDKPKIIYEGPCDIGAALPIPFQYAEPEDVRLSINEIPLEFNIGYSVMGRTATLKVEVAADEKVTVYRRTPLDQQAVFPQNKRFDSLKMNESLDKVCLQQQEQNEILIRTLKVPISTDTVFDGDLPPLQANKALKVKADATGFEYTTLDADQIGQEAIDAAERARVSAEEAEASNVAAAGQAQIATDKAKEATDIVTGFDAHAAEKQNDFDINAATLTARYDNNALAKTNAFNQNAQDMTDGFNTNAMLKMDDFDSHAAEKELAFNTNAEQKTATYNDNAVQKTKEFNDNAALKQAQVDASAQAAKQSEIEAKASAEEAKNSENASQISETNARNSERNARNSAEAAALSETNAKTSEDNAQMFASDALQSEQNASASADRVAEISSNFDVKAEDVLNKAKTSETNAAGSATKAKTSETNAAGSATKAKTSETNAGAQAEEARKWAVGTKEERPEGSSYYWSEEAHKYADQAAKGQIQADWNQTSDTAKDYIKNKPDVVVRNIDQEINSSKTFLKDQGIKALDLDIRTDRNKRGAGLIFIDKNGTQTAAIGPYVNNNGSPECRFVASNGTVSAFAGLGTTQDGQGFFEIPTPADSSNNNDAVTSSWVNKKLTGKQNNLNTDQLNAVNSGITSSLVSKYNGYEAKINGKQATLNAEQLSAVNSKITSAKVTKYDGYEAKINGKQPVGNYQTTGNLSQILDASTTKYPSNKAVSEAISNIDALPSQTGNAGKYLQTDGISASWQSAGGGHMVGELVPFPISTEFTPEGFIKPDGTEFTQGLFPDLWESYLHPIAIGERRVTILDVCTYAEYANEVNTKGACAKWAVDDVRKTFKIPLMPAGYYLKNGDGTVNKAGLPNIEGKTNLDSNTGSQYLDGAFYAEPSSGNYTAAGSAGANKLKFDASKSNPIYGASNTVETNAVAIQWFIYVANAQIGQSAIDWSRFETAVASKLNKDHSNDTKPYLKTTYVNGLSGYNIWSNGYCEQWGETSTNVSAVTITMLKKFKDINYQVRLQGKISTSSYGGSSRYGLIWVISNSSFGITTDPTSTRSEQWSACGYLAEGEY